MENQKLQKMVWVVSGLGVVGFIVLAVGGILLYNNVNKKVNGVVSEQLKGTAAVGELPAYKAEGFIGRPTSQSVTTLGNQKKIELKGHWTKTQIPGFEPVDAKDTDKTTIIIDRSTVINKVTNSTKKGEAPTVEEITYDDFKIDNAMNIYLASYGGLGAGAINATTDSAKSLVIFGAPSRVQ